MTYLEILEAQLIVDEGKRNKMYMDSMHVPTVGVGHNMRDKPLSDRVVQMILEDDIAEAEADARRLVQSFDSLTDARKAVVINMVFNLGATKFAKFKNTIAHIDNGFYDAAADGMMDSLWAQQTGQRAVRLADAMRRG